MKKALLISNLAIKFTNFIIPSIETLQKLGYEVHTCANYSNFIDDKSKYDVKMHHIDFERNPLKPQNIKAYKQLKELMKREKFDLVHCNTPIGGLLGRICAKKLNVPNVVYTAHGFHFYKGAPLINNIIYKNVEKILAKFTDVIITINKEDYEAARKFQLKKDGQLYLVHGVGIDTSSFYNIKLIKDNYRKEMNLKADDIVLIAIGELNRNKNYKTLIEAINLIKDTKIHLLICGIGKEKENLVELVKKYDLEKNVHFLGFRNDIPELLSISDIFVQTSYREGLPRSIMEAMSSGLPCVVSKIRGNVDLIEDGKGGFLNSVDSISEFANSISILSNDQGLRNKMGEFNKEYVKQFDTANVKKELYNIYMNIENKEEQNGERKEG